MPKKPDEPLTYKAAGVDIDAADALVERIKSIVRTTFTPAGSVRLSYPLQALE